MFDTQTHGFPQINRAYACTFQPEKLTIGVVAPIEAHAHDPVPTLERYLERARLADELGFAAIWLRDVPFNLASFGDAGQMHDPFVYLGMLSGVTKNIALGVASVILPLRHPAHVAKAAASADSLSGGRLLLGVASGDRPEEYPAMNIDYASRGQRFRDNLAYIRAMAEDYPQVNLPAGTLSGQADMLPKPAGGTLPLIITGGAQQTPDWLAENGDGWMTYPRDAGAQARIVGDYRRRIAAVGGQNKPVMQSLYVDLHADPDHPPHPIHLGFSSGTRFLQQYLHKIQQLGMNHVALNLQFNHADVEDAMKRLADTLLPEFSL